jgi:formamidopyrimidine-DNA glycosylase
MTNQSVLAGIGIIYADEILYQSGIRPDLANRELKEDEFKRVYDRMLGVLDTAIRCKVNPERVPGDWLLPHRGEGSECPRCGSKIRALKMSGQTAYYCPNCQPER